MSVLFLERGGKLLIRQRLAASLERTIVAEVSRNGLMELETTLESSEAEMKIQLRLKIESYNMCGGSEQEEETKAIVLPSPTGKMEDSPTILLTKSIYHSHVKVSYIDNTAALVLRLFGSFSSYGSVVFQNIQEGDQ